MAVCALYKLNQQNMEANDKNLPITANQKKELYRPTNNY